MQWVWSTFSGSVPVSCFLNLQAFGFILKTIKEAITTGHGPKQNKHPWFCTFARCSCNLPPVFNVLFWYCVLFWLCASSAATKQHPEATSRNSDCRAERREIQFILCYSSPRFHQWGSCKQDTHPSVFSHISSAVNKDKIMKQVWAGRSRRDYSGQIPRSQ